mgnify:CR=1 FL=1
MEYTLNTGRYRSQLIGLLILAAVAMFGVNHRFGAIGVSFLVFVSLLMWKHQKPCFTPEVYSLRKLAIYVFLAYPIAVFMSLLIHQQWEIFDNELDNPVRLIFVIPIFILLSKIKLDERWVVLAFSFGAIAIGLNAIFSFSGGRVGLSYGNPIPMGNVATALAVISLMLGMSVKSLNLGFKFLSILALSLGVAASLLSGTKGGWVSLAIIALYGLFAWRATIFKKVVVVSLVFIALTVFDVAMKNLPSSRLIILKQNIECFIDDPASQCGMGSFGVRVWMNYAGINNFLNHPVTGSGLDTTSSVLDKAKNSELIPRNVHSYNHLHNDFVEILSQMGLLGFVGYVCLFGGFTWIAFRLRALSDHKNPWANALFINTLLFFEFGMTQATLTHASTITYFAFSNALLTGMAFRFMGHEEEPLT